MSAVDAGPVACPACGRRNRVPAVASGTPHCGSCRAPLPWLVAAGDADVVDVVDRSPLPVLLDLWAPWCGPCRAVAPAVARVARELAGHVKAVQVNVDEAPGVAARFGARSIPTLLVLRDGVEIARQVGALPAERLLGWVRATVG
ncbi:thioredoxin family protein [Pseudonocardia abyssalis]|uniref:Thioredoxin fold domain-containing protein n=1 Tax=Pseudonocardia abyssalis TaxID=2792008 RepID=A0ABS6UNI8_9PSEU|nr:thioredoxin domain-containing protein [Pseudonocardia abyssalis]MBW0119467.1 thioredoxin fold domain-containing protein [Pseudonocardia abyssalis]MBW0133805.1 thioredoxin fold domain-containing protein [Pseudonocardia abyssalis]